MAKPYVIVIGNVCSGKSTFLKRFATLNNNWVCFPEDLSDNAWLQPNQTMSVFQSATFFMGYNAKRHLEASRCFGPVLQEACLQHSSIFPQVFYDLGDISLPELKVLQMNYTVFLEFFPLPDIFVYLHAPIDILMKRADAREEPNRSISKRLIPVLQNKLDCWISNTIQSSKIIHIDTNVSNLITDDTVFSATLNEINFRYEN